jgi:hypothetical protein
MRGVDSALKIRFRDYVAEAANSTRDLEFLLDNLGLSVPLDCSVASLEKVEAIFWRFVEEGVPEEISDLDHFAHLIGQYLGECIIRKTGASWVECSEKNAQFSQPCVEGFGKHSWDRVFPVDLALHIQDLPKKKPDFPGVRKRRVFASALERALSAHSQRT